MIWGIKKTDFGFRYSKRNILLIQDFGRWLKSENKAVHVSRTATQNSLAQPRKNCWLQICPKFYFILRCQPFHLNPEYISQNSQEDIIFIKKIKITIPVIFSSCHLQRQNWKTAARYPTSPQNSALCHCTNRNHMKASQVSLQSTLKTKLFNKNV